MGEITSKTTEALRYLSLGIIGIGIGWGIGSLARPYLPVDSVYFKDLNKDNKPDLVIQYANGKKAFFIQQTDGTFVQTLEEKIKGL